MSCRCSSRSNHRRPTHCSTRPESDSDHSARFCICLDYQHVVRPVRRRQEGRSAGLENRETKLYDDNATHSGTGTRSRGSRTVRADSLQPTRLTHRRVCVCVCPSSVCAQVCPWRMLCSGRSIVATVRGTLHTALKASACLRLGSTLRVSG